MTPFSFSTAQTIHFGRGTAATVAEAAARYGRRALLVHGRNAERAAWLLRDLTAHGLQVHSISVSAEPDLPFLEQALADIRRDPPDILVALGGGSAIDAAKAIAALTPSPGAPLDYLEVVGKGQPLAAAPIPVIAVPTTAGTGAEVTKNAVIGIPEHRRKVSLRDDRMIPQIAIVDPALTDHCPPGVTFSSGLDALAQVIEPFLSTKANPMTDALCRDAIPRGLGALLRLAETEDPKARDDLALTSLTGGIALANAKLGAVHGMAAVIGGRTQAPHGEICGSLLPHVLQETERAIAPDSPVAERVTSIKTWIAAALDASMEGVWDHFAHWIRARGLRGMRDLGLTAAEITEIATEARRASSSQTNPIAPDKYDFDAVMARAL
ncbi:iron-containing alcohol dehydrogenase [Cognatiyoonia sp. IB215446]|uniref:iron-containing alcohol dehydrogenase n=1 Tax=Cognatiyoonia sp. IB215446 TaxID=3097355 RepID=UPI002A1866BB|nr:iron-containing alcohol dehydrogenase [Cognatiyoonia sp. IB215446]MDX8348082.1 iron-containing alcohol dehydrogenase [Cognatiyoonia sp. IB215446]